MTVQDPPCWSIGPDQRPMVDGDGPRYTNMYETNRPSVTSGEETDPSDLTFRL